ncbi:hypothetical protein O181_049973 [Austropuccinia psidii MF-1]|uniref:Uncharacterized protein n=1 Tax=Austropuccinia psidii MF-1 TaxID=1389203 RepID=A0A9Q3DYG5_9BASI|nr:hypothetical protein [Austropuccinia psidii MF-1]
MGVSTISSNFVTPPPVSYALIENLLIRTIDSFDRSPFDFAIDRANDGFKSGKRGRFSSVPTWPGFKDGSLQSLGLDSKLTWAIYSDTPAVTPKQEKIAIKWLKEHLPQHEDSHNLQKELEFITWSLNRVKSRTNTWWSSRDLNLWRQHGYDYQKMIHVGDLLQFDSKEGSLTLERFNIAAKSLPSSLGELTKSELLALQAVGNANGHPLYEIRSKQLLKYMYSQIGKAAYPKAKIKQFQAFLDSKAHFKNDIDHGLPSSLKDIPRRRTVLHHAVAEEPPFPEFEVLHPWPKVTIFRAKKPKSEENGASKILKKLFNNG